jgi:hypothetical protein
VCRRTRTSTIAEVPGVIMPVTTVDLYRSVRQEEFNDGVIKDGKAVVGVLYPSFEDKRYKSKGTWRTRRADIKPYKEGGELFVGTEGGTSLFDKYGCFGHIYWYYFTIPRGTVVPDSLKIRNTGYNTDYDATHYQIESLNPMTVAAFKGALDNLARNAVTKSLEDK